MSLPSVFIGSSSEGITVARNLHAQLQDSKIAEVVIWSQGVFGLGSGTLETLELEAPKHDFAILILTPDDMSLSRGRKHNAPRDNVLFELGLFIGAIGRRRTFIVASDAPRLKLPSDLAGITVAHFPEQARKDGRLASALGSAVDKILDAIERNGRRNPDVISARLTKSEVHVRKGDLFTCTEKGCTILLPANEFFDTTTDQNIVDRSCTLGRYLKTMNGRQAAAFDRALNDAISATGTRVVSRPKKGDKPGRLAAFPLGSLMHVDAGGQSILLCATTRLRNHGGCWKAAIDDEARFSSMLWDLWENVSQSPVRGPLFMPIIGSGFGRITHHRALAHILLTYRSAEARAATRLCESLNIVVLDREQDWGDGKWIRNLSAGLLS